MKIQQVWLIADWVPYWTYPVPLPSMCQASCRCWGYKDKYDEGPALR